MGIPQRKEREKDRRRQQIMIATRRVVLEKGYSFATMEDIAREAELSAGTLYLYFKNKEELYASLSIRILQYLVIRLEHVSKEANTSAEERLESLKNALLDVYDFDAPILINMFTLQSSETLHHISLELLTEIKDLARNILCKIVQILEGSMKEDALSDYHPIALADILWGTFSGVVLREEVKKVVNGNEDFVGKNLDLAFDIFIRGLQARQN
ncbi:TetR/AcrR family transcriptional regulator [uncultured Desulfosarcina sp.]|uniref:TetR/AcrR family transcriptional regulator n=1 Tax=uncultured Desulfosarcina sp. TaxID=218289 RepID=UPI0029C6A5A0|nr:TetR/AcrR family transcriptional regulator [uncultured Desulfosarcina sp.]